ncbi:hypothetical protein BRUM_0808 [Bifidobacterium ruminantium]|uniref:Uncharacterized protein n=1 Tax=Bifidobacterium ruminantium TaxID=78346 RepID=A0A087CWL2_BIFRU|nr:hypothetical protein BRUM_0808 [Bifidobacterium ruminantium]
MDGHESTIRFTAVRRIQYWQTGKGTSERKTTCSAKS